jgi:hypothetical protein
VRDPAQGHAVAFVDELADGLLQAHDRRSARRPAVPVAAPCQRRRAPPGLLCSVAYVARSASVVNPSLDNSAAEAHSVNQTKHER